MIVQIYKFVLLWALHSKTIVAPAYQSFLQAIIQPCSRGWIKQMSSSHAIIYTLACTDTVTDSGKLWSFCLMWAICSSSSSSILFTIGQKILPRRHSKIIGSSPLKVLVHLLGPLGVHFSPQNFDFYLWTVNQIFSVWLTGSGCKFAKIMKHFFFRLKIF